MKREKVKTGILRQRLSTRIALIERVVDFLSDITIRRASHVISAELRSRGSEFEVNMWHLIAHKLSLHTLEWMSPRRGRE